MIYKYLRFSTDKQDEKSQEEIINSYVIRKGIKIDDVIKDCGVSGSVSYSHRNLGGLLQSLKSGDTLIVSELSRITRGGICDLSEMITRFFAPNNLRLVICNVGLEIDCSSMSAMAEMQMAIMVSFAKMEREFLKQRTKAALDERKKKIETEGGFLNKKGKWVTHLGGTRGDRKAVGERRKESSRADEYNKNIYSIISSYDKDDGGITDADTLTKICEVLNAKGYTTPKGMAFTVARVRTLWWRLSRLYSEAS